MLATRAQEVAGIGYTNATVGGDLDSCGPYQQRVNEYFVGGGKATIAKQILGEAKYNQIFGNRQANNSYGYSSATDADAEVVCRNLIKVAGPGFFDQVFIQRVKDEGKYDQVLRGGDPSVYTELVRSVQRGVPQEDKIVSVITFAKANNLYQAKSAKCGATQVTGINTDRFNTVFANNRSTQELKADAKFSEMLGFDVQVNPTRNNNPKLTGESWIDESIKKFNNVMNGTLSVEASANTTSANSNPTSQTSGQVSESRNRLAQLMREGKISAQDPNDAANALKNAESGGFDNNLVLSLLKIYDSGITFRTGSYNRRPSGTRTITGGISDHSLGRAMDMVGFKRSKDWNDKSAEEYYFFRRDDRQPSNGLSENGKSGGKELFREVISILRSTGVMKPTQILVPRGFSDIGADLSSDIEPSGAMHFAVLANKGFDGSGVDSSINSNCTKCTKLGANATNGIQAKIDTSLLTEPGNKVLLQDPKIAVIHYTATAKTVSGLDQSKAFSDLAKAPKGTTGDKGWAHYLIDKDGKNYQIVDEKYKVSGVSGEYGGFFEGDKRITDPNADNDNGTNRHAVQYEVHYSPNEGPNPFETISDAQLKSLAGLIAKSGFTPNQVFTHWGVQPESRTDASDWLRIDGKVTPSLLKFVQYAGWAKDEAEAQKVAKQILLNNVENALKVYADPQIKKEGEATPKAMLEKAKADLSKPTTFIESIKNIFGGVIADAETANSTADSILARTSEAIYSRTVSEITDPNYDNPAKNQVYIDNKNTNLNVGDTVRVTSQLDKNKVLNLKITKKIDLKDDGGIPPIRLNKEDFVNSFTTGEGFSNDGVYKFYVYKLTQEEAITAKAGEPTVSDVTENCPSGAVEGGVATADADFAAIMQKIGNSKPSVCGRQITGDNLGVGKGGSYFVSANSGRNDGTGCCYGAVWAGLVINSQLNPDSPWGKVFAKGLDAKTANYSARAIDFHTAMQQTGASGKKVYEELGLTYSTNPKTATVGSVVVVAGANQGGPVGDPAGDINVKTADGNFYNYAKMGFMNGLSNALGVYTPSN